MALTSTLGNINTSTHQHFPYIYPLELTDFMEPTETPKKIHHGRNVKRFREMLGIKQEALAARLGDDWSQKKISLLESKETIEPALLDELARALNVPSEAIRNFSEEVAFNYFNTFNDQSVNQGVQGSFNDQSSFVINPVEKWLEALEENKRLYEELLKSEREKVEILKKIVEGRE